MTTVHRATHLGPALFPPSSLALHSLESIPGSVSVTPALTDEVPEPSSARARGGHLTPSEGSGVDSKRSNMASTSGSGSYFPAAAAGPSRSTSSVKPPANDSASNATNPVDRPRPSPLAIPAHTPDEPLFSAYHEGGPSRTDSKGKRRSVALPLEPTFQLARPPGPSRRVGHQRGDSSADEMAAPIMAPGTPDHTPPVPASASAPSRPKPARRRASTFSGSPPEIAPISNERRGSLQVSRLHAITPSKSLKVFRRRRESLGSRKSHTDDRVHSVLHWPRMADEEARRYEPQASPDPFSYKQPADSEYTIESVSTVATVRPLASPTISPRRSSLAQALQARKAANGTVLLEMSNMADSTADSLVDIILPEDIIMPHDPPPRGSSLDYGSTANLNDPQTYIDCEKVIPLHADVRSVLSASMTGTETSASASADYHSPSSSRDHPLSSASTSLSRSAKSGKEGTTTEKDAALSAIRLQRSLEWEARQGRRRRRLEKRRLILLELVETEVAYVDDLRVLVQVYLPELSAMPSVSDKTADKIARNAKPLLEFHQFFAGKMVSVLKEERLSCDHEPGLEVSICGKLERASRKLAALFVEESSWFAAYNEFCAGSIAAATLVREIATRTDYEDFETRCQVISSQIPHPTLRSLLADEPLSSIPTSPPEWTPSNRSRLHFRDFLITPIQRVCRYPLLLNQLLNAASTPSPDVESDQISVHEDADQEDGQYDVGVDIERALGAMRGVAEEADEARREKEAQVKTATVLDRIEPHPALSLDFLQSLHTCRLIGSLDVLHHHPTVAPLVPPVKVKYLAAFLFGGYLILAKVKKGKVYEAKHYLPLQVFDLIDITEGFLPHSIRLNLRDHNFDLAASCESEKALWATALCEARDESTVQPFELPASVSPFAARKRRISSVPVADFMPPVSPGAPSKRHTLAGAPTEFQFPLPPQRAEDEAQPSTPLGSPTRSSFGFTPDRARRPGQPSTILLRRVSAPQRLVVDRGLLDVFSESCSQARSKAQLHQALFLPDVPPSELKDRMSIRDSTMLRRRRSFLDSRQANFDIAFTGEIKGSVMPVRQSRHAGRRRTPRKAPASRNTGTESATEIEGRWGESADETATGVSEYGTFTGGTANHDPRRGSIMSTARDQSPAPRPQHLQRRSLSNLRRAVDMPSDSSSASLVNLLSLNRGKTASSYQLKSQPRPPARAQSTPVSPVAAPREHVPPVPDIPSLVVPLTQAESDDSGPQFASERFPFPPKRRSSMAADAPIFTLGGGLTNALPPDRPASPWQSLRRSMSFVREKDNTKLSQSSGSSSHSHSHSNAPNEQVTRVPRPTLSRGSTDDGGPLSSASREASSIGLTSEPGSISGDDEAEGVEGIPRRKRSMRIFQSLSRFTPM